VDSSHGPLGEGDALVVGMRRDQFGGGIEPDVAIDGMFGVDETVDEGDECGADVSSAGSENGVALGDERRKESVADQSRADSRSRISASVMGSAS
jgi:hypothetical protein